MHGVGTRIKSYLVENGIKQGFVAEKADLTPSQMSSICADKFTIDCVVYYKICKALNVPLETFLIETR
jgi:transcriptional regulator with XRE-family HTH domain